MSRPSDNFDENLRTANTAITQGYADLVVRYFSPIFDGLIERAKTHLASGDSLEIDFGNESGLVFRQDGNFYGADGNAVPLKDLPELYQRRADRIAGMQDLRGHSTPSIQSAMNEAVTNFRNAIRASLSDSV